MAQEMRCLLARREDVWPQEGSMDGPEAWRGCWTLTGQQWEDEGSGLACRSLPDQLPSQHSQ